MKSYGEMTFEEKVAESKRLGVNPPVDNRDMVGAPLIDNDPLWFTLSPTKIVAMTLGGTEIHRGKLRDLVDFSDTDITLWYDLEELTRGRRETADDLVNLWLGPIALGLKAKSSDPTKGGTIYGFRDRDTVIHKSGLRVMLEAISMGLVPKAVRKELDVAMVARFNKEVFHGLMDDEMFEALESLKGDEEVKYAPLAAVYIAVAVERRARVVFYDILSELLEVILSAPSGNAIGDMVDAVFAANPGQVEKAKEDPKLIGWIMGQVMRLSATKLDPNEVRAIIIDKLA